MGVFPTLLSKGIKRFGPSTFDTEVGLCGLVLILQRIRRLFHIQGLAQQEKQKTKKNPTSYQSNKWIYNVPSLNWNITMEHNQKELK